MWGDVSHAPQKRSIDAENVQYPLLLYTYLRCEGTEIEVEVEIEREIEREIIMVMNIGTRREGWIKRYRLKKRR